MPEKGYFVKSIGYLRIPKAVMEMFGMTSKTKDRLKIFPQPYDVKADQTETELVITYRWKKEDCEKYMESIKGENKNE